MPRFSHCKISASIFRSRSTAAVHAEGDRFTVVFDGKPVLAAEDKTFAEAGRVGLWTKADSVIHFDAIVIAPLDRAGKRKGGRRRDPRGHHRWARERLAQPGWPWGY